MVSIRSVNEIILNLLDYFRTAQPDLDCKPGTVSRDLFIDAPASQLALLYDELGGISNKQSLRLVVGSDLDKLAKNFGVIRRQATPSGGVALLTFSSIVAPININAGSTISANSGLSFSVRSGLSVSPTSTNLYKSIATKYKDQLSFVGITDEYAVEVNVTATSPGTLGNIGRYALSTVNIPGVSNVTNINTFTGGTDQETDAAFRNRILSSFSGSSVGTALGYLNTALGFDGVSDAIVIEPGNTLMTRDGTVTKENSDGSYTILSEGTGGKVDVVIMGATLVENSDSFIFKDKSNNDPANAKNNVVIGQISGDENKTINRKRIDNIKNNQLPTQPVEDILSVTGSGSGSNFLPKSIDSYGRVSGNYELKKDTGIYAGSPWGFDTFAWIDNKISLFEEDRIKGQLNGQDGTTFTDVLEIPIIQQNLPIINENSQVTSDRSIIRLLHTPATSVTRVFNVNTGERYIVSNQNYDGTSPYNSTGRIKISGNTLPSPSDTLQVDYSWIVNYDQYSDYDGLQRTSNPREVTDSIDWGYSSSIKRERVKFELTDNYFIGTSSHSIGSIISANKFTEIDGTVSLITSGTFTNHKAVIISALAIPTTDVNSIKLKNSNKELYVTAQANGSFSNTSQVIDIEIYYITTIILPNDSVAEVGDKVTVIINETDVFVSTDDAGSFSDTQITIPATLVDTSATSLTLEVTYIASVTDLFSSAITSLPASRAGNGYLLSNNNGFSNFSSANISRRESQIVQENLSSDFYVQLSITNLDYDLVVDNILSVIRLSDGLELWNSDYPGTITTSTDGYNYYQLILSGLNTPAASDRVLVIYYANNIRTYQPFSFNNDIISTRIDTLSIDGVTGKFTIPLNNITSQGSGVLFKVIEPNTDIVLFDVTDGYITSDSSTATISSLTQNFNTLADLLNKKVRITGSTDPNNNGIYDILSYDADTNEITISNILSNIIIDQISIIRVLDGQELFKYTGTIDQDNNRVLFPVTSAAAAGDKVYVMFFNFNNLRKSPTRIVGTLSDQIINTGVITVNGITLNKVQDIVFTATNTGLELNLAEAVRKALSLNSSVSISSSIKLAKLIKLEKVITAGSGSDEVLSILTTYDTTNTIIQNNLLFADEMISDYNLGNLDFILPSTSNNTLNTDTQNLPKIGDQLRVTFYYTVDNDSENLSYTGNGALYTNKKFALINKIFVSSGFKASQTTRFTASSFTQPSLGARYKLFYDYTAPKQNERIYITYTYNQLVTDVTFGIENTRPINADILVKAAKKTLVDLTINVVIADAYRNSSTTVLQNLRDQLVSALTTTTLAGIIDSVTLINIAQSIAGIARARILYFNKLGGSGQVLKLQAQENEYFVSNTIIINTETR